ncbi:zinc ribbon domain-containing protein [Desulfurispirillum indicum]|uniref:Regulatory protein, FmdB family n=1 Tax=Desulfurispirillum indicum (strain ATCC BAA-1389 / DSM 22839 / S5) TaxID=653733 RepID=E6W4V0_DESIS|nr:zinc ribbon domain-containing protein [Desulfurispirillum indicum]ADU64828.1 regulatory protein, FmdB family [Desulfurispirillum indicum S5]UCZ56762.1 zinc ribbon domain-containing protein [Desulfurispirillum indicum]
MPIYEYQCSTCSHQFEKMEKMDAPKTTNCPQCQAQAQRQISLSAFALKGGGWYSDGYGTSKASAPASPCAASGGCPSAGQCAAASS